MNPLLYEEHRLTHRRFGEYFRRTAWIGGVALGLCIWMGAAHYPSIGPGLYANAGFSAGGLLLLWGMRALHLPPYAPKTRWGAWLARRGNDWFPAFLIGLQGWFVLLMALLIWFSIAELGFAAHTAHHLTLLGILLLAPVRRILRGSQPPHPSPRRELLSEGLGYLNAILITLFAAFVGSTASLPPGEPLTGELPLGIILLWLAAVLIVMTCIVLFIDHIVRKMPPAAIPEKKDTLE